MEQYLIEHDTLAKVADALITKKYPDQPPANLREEIIRQLDDKIGAKIFGSLDDEQLRELNNLLDDQEKDPAVFQNFFKNANLDLEQKITEAVQEFSNEFLGGDHV